MRRYTGPTTADTSVVTTTETVVATVTVATTPRDNARIQLKGFLQHTNGTNTTALTIRLRRGNGITGTVVGEANAEQISTAAGSTESHAIMAEDTPGEVVNQVYSLTIQQTGASANGSTLSAYVEADTDT